MRSFPTWATAALLLTACGEKTGGAGPDGGSTSTGSSSTADDEAGEGDDETAAETEDATAGETGTDASDTGADVCEVWQDDPSVEGGSIFVTIRSQADTPLFLLVGCDTVFDLEGSIDGASIVWPGPCGSCEDILEDECILCPSDCFEVGVIRIEPGGVVAREYSGHFAVDVPPISLECLPESPCGSPESCKARRRVQAGTYDAAIRLIRDPLYCTEYPELCADCLNPAENGSCPVGVIDHPDDFVEVVEIEWSWPARDSTWTVDLL